MPPKNNLTKTIFDEEIDTLEKRVAGLETEYRELAGGHLKISGADGNTVVEIDLGTETSQDYQALHRLSENPLVNALTGSFRSEDEFGENQAAAESDLSPVAKLLRQNHRLNRQIRRKNKTLGSFFSSGWLVAVGLLVLFFWGGGVFFYTISGGALGGHPVEVRPSPTLKGVTPLAQYSSGAEIKASRVMFMYNPLETELSQDVSPDNSQVSTPDFTPATLPQFTPTPDSEDYDRVGQPPNQVGGLNGYHGAFFAPSRVQVAVLGVDLPVNRAITQDEENGQAKVTWPRPGEVSHFGAYPGELGNMIILGTQQNLNPFRRLQQNDEIRVPDRKGNVFVYRVVAFSPTGQPERTINLDTDSWVFAPTGEALLTIIANYPQPLPPINPNTTQDEPTARDDYTTGQKLAYRAVLVVYAPTKTTQAGIPVAVPDSVWQVSPAATVTPAPVDTPAPDILPTPTESPTTLPEMPNTGGGGCDSPGLCKRQQISEN